MLYHYMVDKAFRCIR